MTNLDNATIDEIENLHKNLIALNETHMIDIPPGFVSHFEKVCELKIIVLGKMCLNFLLSIIFAIGGRIIRPNL